MNIATIFKAQTEKKNKTKTNKNIQGEKNSLTHICLNANHQKIFWQFVGYYVLRILADTIYVLYHSRITPGAKC